MMWKVNFWRKVYHLSFFNLQHAVKRQLYRRYLWKERFKKRRFLQHENIPQLPDPLQLPHFISSHWNCVKDVSIYIFLWNIYEMIYLFYHIEEIESWTGAKKEERFRFKIYRCRVRNYVYVDVDVSLDLCTTTTIRLLKIWIWKIYFIEVMLSSLPKQKNVVLFILLQMIDGC